MFSEFADKIYLFVSKVPFNTLVAVVWGSYLGVFVLTLVLCFFIKSLRACSKSPYLAFTNAFAGLTLALFTLEKELSEAVIVAVLFWVAGYLTYGILCALTPHKKEAPVTYARPAEPVYVTPPPVAPAKPAKAEVSLSSRTAAAPAAKNSVRLEHAIAVTDKLLTKNLSKADRQELEKLKNTLAVLQIKGALTPTEAEILNENFNALLKLMAKYNV